MLYIPSTFEKNIFTPPTITKKIRAAIRLYSRAVTPSSSFKNFNSLFTLIDDFFVLKLTNIDLAMLILTFLGFMLSMYIISTYQFDNKLVNIIYYSEVMDQASVKCFIIQ